MHVELRTRSLPSLDDPNEYVDYVTLTAYNELKKDLDAANHDIRQLRKNGAVLDSQVAEISTLRREHIDMKDQIDSIAIFLRDQYREEISMGQHNRMKNIADVVLYYMGRERILSKRVEQLEKRLERREERD